jgi:hypothetical protein
MIIAFVTIPPASVESAMIKAVLLSAAIGLMASLSQLKATEPPATASADGKDSQSTPNADTRIPDMTNVWRDVRIVTELAAFDISKLARSPRDAWIVARIRPSESSGTAYAQGVHIEAETGRVIDSGIRPSVVIKVNGKWKLIELLSGEAPREGAFQWTEPPPNPFDLNRIDMYAPVFKGKNNDGTVICHFFADKSGAEQFANVTSIPDGWEIFVKPAYEYYREHAADFADDNLSELRKEALSDNPLIGLTAIRHIVEKAGEAENTDAYVDLARSLPKYRQAVFIVQLLKSNDEKSRDIVSKAVGQVNNASELPGMALGLYCSLALRPHVKSEREMLDKLREKWKSFDPRAADEMSLNRLLLAPGVQQGNPTSRKE